MYIADVVSIDHRHGLPSHFYEDDFQIYLSCRWDTVSAQTSKRFICISEIDDCMAFNRLILNQDKTDIYGMQPKTESFGSLSVTT